MQVNARGLEIIQSFEGVMDGDTSTVNLDPYVCPGGVWTIGWGHALSIDGRYLRRQTGVDSDRAAAYNLFPGGITISEAETLLWADTAERAMLVSRMIKVPVNSDQFSALVSLAFNIGTGRLMRSDTLACLNDGDYQRAANNFKWWRKSGGKILDGLVRRRATEKSLFIGDYQYFAKVEAANRYLGFS